MGVEVSEKQGRSCCGCCCDMRRAVIILSLLGILNGILSPIIAYFTVFENAKDDIPDDNTTDMEKIDDLFRNTIILASFSAVCFLFAIAGGIRFNKHLVFVNAIYMPASFIATVILNLRTSDDVDEYDYGATQIIGPAIGVALSFYVNVSFILEIRKGIMSRENYPKEEQSCCCV